MKRTPLQQLRDYGQSPWLDALSRGLVRGGGLRRLVRGHGIRGVTSNPSILARAITADRDYDDQIRALASAGRPDTPEATLRALALADVRDACDVLRPVWEESEGGDGHVSVALDPRLAHDTAGLRELATVTWQLVGRPNALVKIPATRAGVAAIEDATAAGIPVNATLIFSLARHREVAAAYIRGLERLVAAGGDPARVASVAGVLVSRVDAEVDARLEALGGAATRLRGRLAIANARLAYQQYKDVFSGDAWRALAARGARPQRCVWASTSTKDAGYGRMLYVEELIGAETVTTMPPATIAAFERHGVVADKIERGVHDARKVVEDVRAAGIDLDDVWATLEAEGVRAFADSFRAALDHVARRQAALR